MRQPIPLSRRKLDWIFIGFFAFNLLFVSYNISLEQLVVASPERFEYPIWPLRPVIDAVHWWGRNFDPLLMARPPFFRSTIWIDALYFGPFYAFALWAFVKGRDWIKNWALVWSGLMFANVSAILFEEWLGVRASHAPWTATLAYAAWLVIPLLLAWRVWAEHPLTEPAAP
jgi:hypothetical protein